MTILFKLIFLNFFNIIIFNNDLKIEQTIAEGYFDSSLYTETTDFTIFNASEIVKGD
jgi:hypothetical protein